jgi:hypothetical protein
MSHRARSLLLGENLQAGILLTLLVRVTHQASADEVNVDFFFQSGYHKCTFKYGLPT